MRTSSRRVAVAPPGTDPRERRSDTGRFDAAVCLLTLYFIPAAERLDTLRHLHRRLKPGAPLVVAHHSFAPQPPERDVWLARCAAYSVGWVAYA